MAARRLLKELRELNNDQLSEFSFGPINDDIFEMEGHIVGPQDTPYYGGIYKLLITNPRSSKPPHIQMVTKIYHPNINDKGDIKLDILHSNWSPMLTISKLLIEVIDLLKNPRINEGVLMPDIAKQFKVNPTEYIVKAKQWNYIHAGGSQIQSHDVSILRLITVDSLEERYEMIHKSITNLFGDILGGIFENKGGALDEDSNESSNDKQQFTAGITRGNDKEIEYNMDCGDDGESANRIDDIDVVEDINKTNRIYGDDVNMDMDVVDQINKTKGNANNVENDEIVIGDDEITKGMDNNAIEEEGN